MSPRPSLALLAALLALASTAAVPVQAAPTKKSPPRSCFWPRDVRNYATQGDRVVNIRVGVRDVYRLDLLGPCHDIEWPIGIALINRGGGAICSPLDAEIAFRSQALGPQRCPVRGMRKLTPQEVAALPKRARP